MFNELVVKSLPIVPKSIVKVVAKRYIAGESISSAMECVRQLNLKGATGTIDLLGEFVTLRSQSDETFAICSSVLDAVKSTQVRTGMSVKLTSLGLDIDDEYCYQNVASLIKKAHDIGRFVRIDMENSPYTDKTLNLYKRLRNNGLDNTGVVIQAYMRRSEQDIDDLLSFKKLSVRLCKGIYIEPEEIAYKGKDEVRNNWKKLLVKLFERGAKIGIATHDDELIDFAVNYIEKNRPDPEQFEFQMLLGVREEKRDALIRAGYRMRIYVPFGEDWYGYSVRRMKENPQVAGHVMRAILTGK